jgi:glycosyltransferase involved in cell wall biosynthesis
MENQEQFLISFAIPTYNFGKFIEETVRSVEDGVEILKLNQFEIVILDGGSTDQTDEVVQTLSEEYKNIRYIKQATRGGIDRDINTVAELTTGKYIWLFSADDLLVPGWDKYIIPLLSTEAELFLVPAILCNIKMIPLRPNPIFLNCEGDNPIEFEISPENDSLVNYLNRAATLEALFSFLGAILVKADFWRSLPAREDYYGSCWAHCTRLIPGFFKNIRVTYLNQFLIKKRGENDSFMENGLIARIGIAVNGWGKIINEFFTENRHKQILFDKLRKDMPILLFVYAKISAKEKNEIKRLNAMAKFLLIESCPTSTTKFNYFIYRLTPASPLLNAIILPFLPTLKPHEA